MEIIPDFIGWDLSIEDVAVPESQTVIKSGLNPEHLPIFDCAFKPFKGERSLHYLGHLRMMVACHRRS